MLRIYDLRSEYLTDPVGIDAPFPRLSWKLESDQRGVMQTSYRIRAVSEGTAVWDSGKVISTESQYIAYGGERLKSRERISWTVEVTAVDETGGEMASESEKASFEMGLLTAEDWKALWIDADDSMRTDAEADIPYIVRKPAVYLKKNFTVRQGLKYARIYQTAHGLYDFSLNGLEGTKDRFNPGLTSYYYRIQYQTYDVTKLLKEGDNIWTVELADGWWRGVTGGTVVNNFGRQLAFLGQLELFYEDGTSETITSDQSFSWSTGPLLACDMQMGDIYDARRKDERQWKPVNLTKEHTDVRLIGKSSVSVREKEVFQGKDFRDAGGSLVIDFGQNIAGYVHMKLHDTKAGQAIRLIHGEGLKDGAFSLDNISNLSYKAPAYQEVIYTCRGGEESYCPKFSVFGFRYVKVEGYDGEIRPGDFTASALYSDMRDTGTFSCSSEQINQLVRNSLWSQKGNFLDVPVDCPTRERNAWTGDAQIYAPTAACFMDTYSFYEKWLKDQTIEQYASGKVGITFPSTSSVHDPNELKKEQEKDPLAALAGPGGNGSIGEDAVGWGDSAVWIPYMIYRAYGDRRILENQYETARRWLEYELDCSRKKNPLYENLPQYQTIGADGRPDAEFIYDTNFQYGEWNEPIDKTPKEMMEFGKLAGEAKKSGKSFREVLLLDMAKKGKPEPATAYVYRSARAVAHMADILGKEEEASHYQKIAERIHDGFYYSGWGLCNTKCS